MGDMALPIALCLLRGSLQVSSATSKFRSLRFYPFGDCLLELLCVEQLML
jgi:hypothetical protein